MRFDIKKAIAESRVKFTMETKIDLPADVFGAQFPQADSAVRVLAIVDLVRAKCLREREAQEMLGVQRWELIERMREAGTKRE